MVLLVAPKIVENKISGAFIALFKVSETLLAMRVCARVTKVIPSRSVDPEAFSALALALSDRSIGRGVIFRYMGLQEFMLDERVMASCAIFGRRWPIALLASNLAC